MVEFYFKFVFVLLIYLANFYNEYILIIKLTLSKFLQLPVTMINFLTYTSFKPQNRTIKTNYD